MNEVVNFLEQNKFLNVKYNEPLSKHTTFKVGGNAALLVEPESKEKLYQLIAYLNENNIKYKIFGGGSNILASDNYYDGVIIKTKKALNYLQVNNDVVTVGAGYSLVKLAYDMVKFELSGIEFLGGIPGTIGGAIYMNAGAYKREMKDVVLTVTVLNKEGKEEILTIDDLKYGYRKSIFQELNNVLIVDTKLQLEKSNRQDIINLLNARMERRSNTQPLEYPCAGSTFRNPENTHAYLLIEEAGLRGHSIGGAKVSEKHCNFVINYNNAQSSELKALVDYIIQKVYEKTGITLIPEIEFFNW